jgi:hypothetical protein
MHDMAAAKYPISTSADEFTRLKIQVDLFRNDARTMLAQIGGFSIFVVAPVALPTF